jgi:hypothetical protein
MSRYSLLLRNSLRSEKSVLPAQAEKVDLEEFASWAAEVKPRGKPAVGMLNLSKYAELGGESCEEETGAS